jgi:hypothetical protein
MHREKLVQADRPRAPRDESVSAGLSCIPNPLAAVSVGILPLGALWSSPGCRGCASLPIAGQNVKPEDQCPETAAALRDLAGSSRHMAIAMVAGPRKSSIHPWVTVATPSSRGCQSILAGSHPEKMLDCRARTRCCVSARSHGSRHGTACPLYVLPMNADARAEPNAGADGRRLSVGMGVTIAAALIGLAVGVGLGWVTGQSSHAPSLALAPAQAAEGPSGGSLPTVHATAPLPTLRHGVGASPKRTVTTAATVVPLSSNGESRSQSNTESVAAVSPPSPTPAPSRSPTPTPSNSGGGLQQASGGE